MDSHNLPPPAYTASAVQQRGAASLNTVPLDVLHRILALTLDHRATPSAFDGDAEEERIRRLWALFRSLRGVNRRFCLGAHCRACRSKVALMMQSLPPSYGLPYSMCISPSSSIRHLILTLLPTRYIQFLR